MQVKKRDGRVEEFDKDKIRRAILKAGLISTFIDTVVDNATDNLYRDFGSELLVDQIHDYVEIELMHVAPAIAKGYILYRTRHAQLPTPDSKAIEAYIHVAKYARYVDILGRRETYTETVNRVATMHFTKLPALSKEILLAFTDVTEKRCLPSMRSMQFAGPAIEQHNERMYNCSFTHVDRVEVFGDALYLLLCGCGVGYSVQTQHVDKLPALLRIDRRKVRHFAVCDNIEGWGDAIKCLVSSYTHFQDYIEFGYSKIRPEGSPLKTSGGVAPGHLPMKKMLEDVRAILDGAQGRKLKPIECHDIICRTAQCVLAGGVRRSSLIALFSKDDLEMLYCKATPEFQHGGKNDHRSLANNSVVLNRSTTSELEFKSLMELNRTSHGEPGFFFCDDEDWGCNPCGEIMLYPKLTVMEDTGGRNQNDTWIKVPREYTGFAFCNLTEVNAARCETKEEFLKACKSAAIIGTLQATYTKFPYLGRVSEAISERDALIGVSITGIQDNPKCMEWMDQGKWLVIDTNRIWASKLGIKRAARSTCIKPSGTASLELGCVGSGIHYHHSERYFRRIIANQNESVAKQFRQVNPHMVEDMPNGDWCITFPVAAPRGADTMKNYNVFYFLGEIFLVYDSWIDGHNISSTVVFRENEWDDIIATVWKHRASIAAMTFLPASSDKQIPFMPREAVETEADEVRWKNLVDNYKEVVYSGGEGTSFDGGCDSEGCDV